MRLIALAVIEGALLVVGGNYTGKNAKQPTDRTTISTDIRAELSTFCKVAQSLPPGYGYGQKVKESNLRLPTPGSLRLYDCGRAEHNSSCPCG